MKDRKKVDIKYINVPNICFSLVNKNDSRESYFKKQRIKRGFDDSELWSLAGTIAKFVIPRLESFIEINEDIYSHSRQKDQKKYIKDLRKIIKALNLVIKDDEFWVFTKKEKKDLREGLDLFSELFMTLWS